MKGISHGGKGYFTLPGNPRFKTFMYQLNAKMNRVRRKYWRVRSEGNHPDYAKTNEIAKMVLASEYDQEGKRIDTVLTESDIVKIRHVMPFNKKDPEDLFRDIEELAMVSEVNRIYPEFKNYRFNIVDCACLTIDVAYPTYFFDEANQLIFFKSKEQDFILNIFKVTKNEKHKVNFELFTKFNTRYAAKHFYFPYQINRVVYVKQEPDLGIYRVCIKYTGYYGLRGFTDGGLGYLWVAFNEQGQFIPKMTFKLESSGWSDEVIHGMQIQNRRTTRIAKIYIILNNNALRVFLVQKSGKLKLLSDMKLTMGEKFFYNRYNNRLYTYSTFAANTQKDYLQAYKFQFNGSGIEIVPVGTKTNLIRKNHVTLNMGFFEDFMFVVDQKSKGKKPLRSYITVYTQDLFPIKQFEFEYYEEIMWIKLIFSEVEEWFIMTEAPYLNLIFKFN